jgi:primosomal protein N' (replication factor Y)
MYADVVFPLKLPPLTYKVPEDASYDLKGRIVKAPLMGKSYYGIVVSVNNKLHPCLQPAGTCLEKKKIIKEILEIHHHFASELTLSFLKWLSDYYLMPMGIALKSSFFEETISATVRQCDSAAVWKKCGEEKKYNTFLFHASSISDEYSFLFKTLSDTSQDMHGAIILVPEVGQIERLESMLKDIFGKRLCVLHSKLTKAKRTDTIRKIISGESDIVLGTRSAILAPLMNVSLIAVLNEHSSSYKGEEGLRYNARDVAVMRGFMEKSSVFLTSVCPSVESIYNEKTGKYRSVQRAENQKFCCEKHPKIKIIDMKKEKTSVISRNILKDAKDITSKRGRFLFLINRKGYSLIRCEDCEHIARCNKCSIPLIFYKGKNMVRCHYCGHEEIVIESCGECRGFNIRPFGAGVERIREELEKALKINALLIEKTKDVSKTLPELPAEFTPFVIGTAYAAKRLKDKKFDAAALFNIDMLLSMPDFRAYERAFQEVIQISQMVKTEGYLYLQTWNSKNKILRFIKNYDFHGFYKSELAQRKALDYPPISRIILFNIFTKKDFGRLLHDIQKVIYNTNTHSLELLGPAAAPSTMKSFNHCIQILLKSKDRRILHEAAERLLKEFAGLKDIKIKVDVDPLKI